MELIERIFDRTAKIAVVGDGMIDSDYQILSERLNPEGAMPLWLSQTDKPSFSRPGGAARVAHLLKNFHSDIRYFGIINEELAEILESNEISSRYSEVTNCVVPIKKRFYCGGTPVFRWDVERPQLGLAVDELSHHQHLLRRKLAEFQADVVIFSDYGKGVFDDTTRWLDYIGDAISIVDAKYPPIKKWEGCHIFKPNAKEASEISGIPDPIQQCRYFSEVLGSTAIVVTDGGNGFYGSVGHRSFQFRPDVKREAKSVVGAGDAFSGILAICQAHCIDLIESAQIAWTGANVYVSRLDNRPISIHDILFELEVKRVEPKWLRYRDFNLVFTNGVFDLMHVGHIDFLKRAKLR
jgi:D-beta-D-heptose 7-phosphate kinase / D-beta-D-heptose 1-phosphate adenosyltransferase